jgi:hypothetical protein
MGEESSICSKRVSLARGDPNRHQKCVRANIPCVFTFASGVTPRCTTSGSVQRRELSRVHLGQPEQVRSPALRSGDAGRYRDPDQSYFDLNPRITE